MPRFLLILVLSSFIYLNAQYVSDPLSPWNEELVNIDSAIVDITPFAKYAQVDLTLNYSAKNTYFDNGWSSLWLEVVTNFKIPDNTIVIDSWLWIEDYISEAYLIDLHTATNVYESYVTRTQDPSLLRYTQGRDDQLSLNIYPLPANSYRKIKLTFLVPIIDETNAFSIEPINDILMKENSITPSYCEIKVNNSDTYVSGALRTSAWNYSVQESSASYTRYEMDLNAIDHSFAISYDKSTEDELFSFHEGVNSNYYFMETFIPFDYNTCFFGSINKTTNDSSLVFNEFINIESYSSGFTYHESGMYFNDPPENFVLEYVCDNQVVKDSLNPIGIESSLAEKVWANDKIMDLTQNKTNSYSYYYGSSYEPDYTDILLTSMEHRVLSFYTAFLALPQEDTVEASLDNDNNFFEITTSLDEVNKDNELTISCHPNPFKERLTITIKLPSNIDLTDLDVKVIDVSGRLIHSFEFLEVSNEKELTLHWSPNENKNEVGNGIYFILVESNDEVFTYEVLKQ